MFAHLARARGGAERRRGGGAATGSTSTTAGSRQHDDGLRTCARSRFPGWRVGALYPLARGCRAPRRMRPLAPPIPFWCYRVVAGAPRRRGRFSYCESRWRRRWAPSSYGITANALNLHRNGGRNNHVCASCARARRSRARPPPVGAAPQLRGRRRRPPDRTSMMMAFGSVLALDFRAGALVLFIP